MSIRCLKTTARPKTRTAGGFLSLPVVLATVLGGSAWCLTPADGATVAHWRFEDGAFLQDSVGGFNLTTTGTVTGYALPLTGAGSDFPNPVPITGDTNLQGADFGLRTGHLTVAHDAALAPSTFTVEAFANLSSASTSRSYIASRWNATDNQRSWGFGVASSTGGTTNSTINLSERELYFSISPNGLGTTPNVLTIGSGVQLTLDQDYYLAVSFAPTGPTSGDITFWVQNLTTGGSLQQINQTISGIPFAVTSGTFQVGTLNQDAGIRWAGVLDEVRFSNQVLTANQLLVSPEPGRALLLALAGCLMLAHRRRRKAD